MSTLDHWLAARGPSIAGALEERREQICESVSVRFADAFRSLCYDDSRPDADSFQRLTFHETPRRFHRLLQVVLRLQAPSVVEREYRWSAGILPRFGVTDRHMLALVRWYFEAARVAIAIDSSDRQHLNLLEVQVVQMIERSISVESLPQLHPTPSRIQNGHTSSR